MDTFDIPIFTKTYEFYKELYKSRLSVPKQDRYVLWQKIESVTLDIIEAILLSATTTRSERIEILERASMNLNMLRVFLRLAKDVAAIEQKKYLSLEDKVDEIGRMLGGWIKSSKNP